MAILKVYNGTSFVTAIGKTFDGTVFQEKMKFFDGVAFVDLFTSLAVSMSSANVSNVAGAGTAFAGIEFNLNGVEFASTVGGVFSVSRGNWLDEGINSQVWVERVINSGSLNWLDAGTGRLPLTTSRRFGVLRSSNGSTTTGMTFNMYDAASGGNLLQTVTYNLIATLVII